MQRLKAFWRGLREFRLSYTTYYADPSLANCYDAGRDLAHLLTLRRFED